MFFGALVKAYSRPVIEAAISENAMKTYAGVYISVESACADLVLPPPLRD